MAARVKEYAALLAVASNSCMAAEANPQGRLKKNLQGYKAYVDLVQRQLRDKCFGDTKATMRPYLSMTMHALFCNNLHALSCCVAHEMLPLAHHAPLIAALEEAYQPCQQAGHFEGLAIIGFGLGFHFWSAGTIASRDMAISWYAAGKKAGQDAAAQGIAFGRDAVGCLEMCNHNLDKMAGKVPAKVVEHTAEELAALRAKGGTSFGSNRFFFLGEGGGGVPPPPSPRPSSTATAPAAPSRLRWSGVAAASWRATAAGSARRMPGLATRQSARMRRRRRRSALKTTSLFVFGFFSSRLKS